MICPLMKLIRRFLLQGMPDSIIIICCFGVLWSGLYTLSETCSISQSALWHRIARTTCSTLISCFLQWCVGFTKSLYFGCLIYIIFMSRQETYVKKVNILLKETRIQESRGVNAMLNNESCNSGAPAPWRYPSGAPYRRTLGNPLI